MKNLLELSENIGINAYTFDIGDSNSYVEITAETHRCTLFQTSKKVKIVKHSKGWHYMMRVVTEIRHVDNPLNWYYGTCGESTLLLDSFMHQLHVGDKVLIVSATGDITTSFVVHPDPQICHYVLEDLSKCNPFIMGIKGMSSKKLLGRNIEKYFGITAYDIDRGVMSQDPKIF